LHFQKSGQLFIRMHYAPLPVVAMRVSNKDRSAVGINRCNTALTPTGFAEIVSDDFPLLHPTQLDFDNLIGRQQIK
jgi:hypothetical protein